MRARKAFFEIVGIFQHEAGSEPIGAQHHRAAFDARTQLRHRVYRSETGFMLSMCSRSVDVESSFRFHLTIFYFHVELIGRNNFFVVGA